MDAFKRTARRKGKRGLVSIEGWVPPSIMSWSESYQTWCQMRSVAQQWSAYLACKRFNSNTMKSNNNEFIGWNLTSSTLDYDSIRKLIEWVIKLKIGSWWWAIIQNSRQICEKIEFGQHLKKKKETRKTEASHLLHKERQRKTFTPVHQNRSWTSSHQKYGKEFCC